MILICTVKAFSFVFFWEKNYLTCYTQEPWNSFTVSKMIVYNIFLQPKKRAEQKSKKWKKCPAIYGGNMLTTCGTSGKECSSGTWLSRIWGPNHSHPWLLSMLLLSTLGLLVLLLLSNFTRFFLFLASILLLPNLFCPSLPPLSLYLGGGRGTEFPYNLFIRLFVKQCLQDIQKGCVLSTLDPCSKEKEAWTIFLFCFLSSAKIVLPMHCAFSMEQ